MHFMFLEFFKFELRYWLRGWMIYIFVGVITFLFGLATGSDFVRISAGEAGNTLKNAPFLIAIWYSATGTLTCFMAAAIYDSAASRDFTTKMSDILYSKPVKKWHYLLGRFSAASVIAVLPSLGISLGVWIAKLFNLSDTENWGPFDVSSHVTSIIFFAIPNTLLFGSIVFAISTVTRSTIYSFLGLLGLLVVYGVGQSVIGKLEFEMLGALSDPFGSSALSTATKYWTVDELNTRPIPITMWMIENRIIWLVVAVVTFGLAGWRFSFEIKSQKQKKVAKLTAESTVDSVQAFPAVTSAALPVRKPSPRWFDQFWSTLRSDVTNIVRTATYIFILAFASLDMILGLFLGTQEYYGLYSFPLTYRIVEQIEATLVVFPLAVITYFTGMLVWRDRDSRLHEIVGATPSSNSVFAASRLLAMLIVIMPIIAVGIGTGCLYQTVHGYYRYELGVYIQELAVLQGLRFLFFIMVGLVVHTLSPNKYVGYAGFVLFVVLNNFVWRWLRWDTLLFRYGALPTHVYSDMFGIAPYKNGIIAFGIYWTTVSSFLLWFVSAIMHRGTPASLAQRCREGLKRTSRSSRVFVVMTIIASVSMGGWLYYQTRIVNESVGAAELESRQADYEKKYESLANIEQPKITTIHYDIDIFPESRNVKLQATQTIVNKSQSVIEKLYVNTAPYFETDIDIPRATLVEEDKRLQMRIYELSPAMAIGESMEMRFTVSSKNRGIENQVRQTSFVQNGTFFNNEIAPQFGYNSSRRIMNPKRRKEFSLPEATVFPELERECGDYCMVHYISNDSDWVTVDTVISTTLDQTAVAPGTLLKNWQQDGRNYFHYQLDHKSLNFYSFISAKYEVARSKVGDIDTEVYYHKQHAWNVPKMTEAIQRTLEYCTKNFGPYKHKQARIIEFPRVAQFAQAFPGTMPYSESIGFISNLEKPDDIDMVHYVVAHEMGHQWWAHQVIGARMQGATVLSESLAQYTALMVMREKYGEDMMHKFLEYEADRYLRSRGTEQLKERPLVSVDPNQGYIHYQKGGIVLYNMAELIGEDRVNAALQSVIQKYAYQGPPYPNSYALIDALKAHTPESLHYMIKDLFEEITLFGNRTLEASAKPIESGRYLVKLKIECEKFKADAKGKETSVPMGDWLEIGAFAKPEPGKRYGKLLHKQRVQLASGVHELEFEVAERPDKAGVDPQNLLIDRVPKDNLKSVTIE